MVKTDLIKEIKIDQAGRLCIFPEKEKFIYIWRSATEVHWDEDNLCLYAPPPREYWKHSYLKWYQRILFAAKDEYGVNLLLTSTTKWDDSVPIDIRNQILSL
jgi:hypothetical protein